MKRVFLSHSTRDRSVAQQVCKFLEAQKIDCWIAPRDIVAGEDWDESIVRAIHTSATVVLILSEHANRSPEIKREVGIASKRQVPVVPFRIEDVELSPSLEWFMSRTHWLDAFPPPLEQYLDALAATLARLRERPGSQPNLEIEPAVHRTTATDRSLTRTNETPLPRAIESKIPQILYGAARLAPTADGQVRYRRSFDQSNMRVFSEHEFNMGSATGDIDERPPHRVKLTTFLLDEQPVSVRQFAAFLTLWGSDRDDEGNLLADVELTGLERNGMSWQPQDDGSAPMTGVTWYGAHAYANWAGMHLPSEAQLELALAMESEAGLENVSEGRRFFGIVRLWCADTYDETFYQQSPHTNPLNVKPGPFVVVRGDSPYMTRRDSAARQFHGRSEFFLDLGFCCALTIPELKAHAAP